MRIFFVRHGESEANLLQEISNRGWKHGLTGTGRRQALALAERLKPERPVRIYTSPLMRAVQTAEILAQALGAAWTAVDALREYDCGIAEGRADEEAWEWYARGRREWWELQHPDYRIPDGESLNDIRARFEPLLDKLLDGTMEGGAAGPLDFPNATPILISHGGVYQCVLPFVLANVDYALAASLPFPNTGYVLAETIAGWLQCVEWCGTKLEAVEHGRV